MYLSVEDLLPNITLHITLCTLLKSHENDSNEFF